MKSWAGGGAKRGPPSPAASVERRRSRIEQPGRVLPGDKKEK
jgi:hypothetical protein